MQEEKKFWSRSKKILIGLLLFLVFMWICTLVSKAVYAYRLPMVSTTSPESKYIEHIVETEGIVIAGGEKPVTYLKGLRIDTVAVRVGDRVEEGDELFQLDMRDLDDLITGKKEEISKVSVQINTILENQAIINEKKELELARAREDYDTTSRLKNTEVGRAQESYSQAEQELEDAGEDKELKNALQGAAYGEADAKAQRDEAIKDAGRKVEDIQLPDTVTSELEIYRMEVSQLKGQLAMYQEILEAQGVVTAPHGGVITDISVSAGGRVPDTAVLLISDDNLPCQFKVVLDKDQKKYVSLGDNITIKLDGKSEMEAVVEYLAESRTVAGSYEVLIDLPEGLGAPGVSGKLTCSEAGEKYSCCVSPQVIHKKDDRSYVYVLREREGILGMECYVDEVNVKVIDKNDSWAAIEAGGLDKDSKIIVSATKEVKMGDVVRSS